MQSHFLACSGPGFDSQVGSVPDDSDEFGSYLFMT